MCSSITYLLISKKEFLLFGFSIPCTKRMLHRVKLATGLYTRYFSRCGHYVKYKKFPELAGTKDISES